MGIEVDDADFLARKCCPKPNIASECGFMPSSEDYQLPIRAERPRYMVCEHFLAGLQIIAFNLNVAKVRNR